LWIVRVALDRPYTFIVFALMIVILSGVAITRTPTDIFPNIDIPVVAVDWTYTGLNPEEMEGRLTSPYERQLTKTVDNIQHIESTTLNGQAIVKTYLQPGASLDTANAQITSISQAILRQLPPGTLPRSSCRSRWSATMGRTSRLSRGSRRPTKSSPIRRTR
jgi:multidrug efflux pump subunit AcrB